MNHTVSIIETLNFSSIVFEVAMSIVKIKLSKVSSNRSQIISNITKRHTPYTKLSSLANEAEEFT